MNETLFGLACLVLLVAVWRSRRSERDRLAMHPEPTVAMLPVYLRAQSKAGRRRMAKKRRRLWDLSVPEKLPEVGP